MKRDFFGCVQEIGREEREEIVKTIASRHKRDDICPSIRRSCVLLGVNRSTVYKPRVPVSC